jgi:glycosyltransferase involved in cell wall biosynthesis
VPENKFPQVSVLMPVYNASRYLEAAVASIQAQTYPNFELLMVDDASQDDSWEILQRLAAADPRLRLFRNPHNMGVPRSRNLLFRNAAPESEFLAIMDSDDLALPERLSRQVSFLQSHPQLQGVGSALDIINEEGQIIASRSYECDPVRILRQALTANPFAHPSLMLRRSLLSSVGHYNESFRSCEDYEFLMRALEQHALANLPDTLLQYRISSQQWKQTHLKDTLSATLAIQRRYLFRRRFFSWRGLFSHGGKYLLYLLPSSLIMRLFMRLTYSPGRHSEP